MGTYDAEATRPEQLAGGPDYVHAGGVDFHGAFGDQWFCEGKGGDEFRAVGWCVVERCKSVDLVRYEVQPTLLTELHALDERLPGVAARSGIVRITDEHCLDPRLVRRKVVSGLDRWQQVVVEVLVRGRSSNNDVDVLPCSCDTVETNCSLVSLIGAVGTSSSRLTPVRPRHDDAVAFVADGVNDAL